MKRHLTTAAGGLLGIFLTAALLQNGASVIQGRQNTAAPEFTLETPDLSDVPHLGEAETDSGEAVPIDLAEGSTAGPEGKSVRDIAPEQFGMPEVVTAKPLERIEARQALSDPVAKPESIPSVLRHPVALSAGLVQFDGDRLLQLDGLIAQTAGRTCEANGKSWPCGVVARTAFRNFLRARALLCDVPKNGWEGTLTTTCTVNGTDPAAWLAENGWAEAKAGSPLEDKVEAAKRSRLGFFGDDPRDLSATPMPLDETAVPGGLQTDADTLEPDL
jgi:hypothetical protein